VRELEELEAKANSGDADSMLALSQHWGQLFRVSFFALRHCASWLGKAANAGNQEALGKLESIRSDARGGDSAAMYFLHFAEVDEDVSHRWLLWATKAGSADAARTLIGQGGTELLTPWGAWMCGNKTRAEAEFRSLADNGNADAMVILGSFEASKNNQQEALALWRVAALRGNNAARQLLNA